MIFRRKKFKLKRLLVVLLLLTTMLFCSVKVLGIDKWKDLDTNKIIDIKQTLIIYDDSGNEMLRLTAGENRIKISIDDLPKHVINAFISAEDARFFEHKGIDFKRIIGSAWADVKKMSYAQGASTITEQLIKNSHLTNEKTFSRKLQEAVLAYQLEKKYSKNEILEMYLNYIYFGRGAYGIQTAAQTYFGVDAKDLSVSQAAMLAGVLKAPSKYAPHLNMEKAINRRNTVLNLMRDYGYLSKEECETYKAEEVTLAPAKQNEYSYGYYTDMVLDEAAQDLGISVEDLLSGGYKVYTPMNKDLQQKCEEIYTDSKLFPPDSQDGTMVQSASVVLDNKTGAIKAVIGGREHTTMRALNRATMMTRQPGSTIKPIIVFAPAFEEGVLTPATVLDDSRKNFDGYSPSNFGDRYYGKVTVRQSLVRSLNVPAVEGLQMIGVEAGKSFAEKLGITFDEKDNNLALALGGFTKGCTPLQIANAYQSFGNEGNYIENYSVSKITDSDGNSLFEKQIAPQSVMSKQTAFLMNDILANATASSVTNKLSTLPYSISSKTGTVGYNGSDGYSDAWIAAYTPDYSVSVWMGYDSTDKTHYLPKNDTGSTYPSFVAKEIYSYLYKDKNAPSFAPAEGISKKKIDKLSLMNKNELVLATSLTPADYTLDEYFSSNMLPTMQSGYWALPSPPSDIQLELNELRQPIIKYTALNDYVNYKLYRVHNGERLCINTVSNKQNANINFTDAGVVRGESYEYYVVPEHSNIFDGNKLLQGYASQSVTVTIP